MATTSSSRKTPSPRARAARSTQAPSAADTAPVAAPAPAVVPEAAPPAPAAKRPRRPAARKAIADAVPDTPAPVVAAVPPAPEPAPAPAVVANETLPAPRRAGKGANKGADKAADKPAAKASAKAPAGKSSRKKPAAPVTTAPAADLSPPAPEAAPAVLREPEAAVQPAPAPAPVPPQAPTPAARKRGKSAPAPAPAPVAAVEEPAPVPAPAPQQADKPSTRKPRRPKKAEPDAASTAASDATIDTPARAAEAPAASPTASLAPAEMAPDQPSLQDTPAVAEAPAVRPEPQPEPTPAPSTVTIERGPRHRLVWTAGYPCSPELEAAAAALSQPCEAAPLVNDLALIELVRLARERRHTLLVDEDVWRWVAPARDMRERVNLLELAHPAGPASPALAALVALPLRTYQAEGALYATCAGRCVLADDAGLGKTVQAIAAAQVFGAQFGAERVLVLCPPGRTAHWHAQWQAVAGLAATVGGVPPAGDSLPAAPALAVHITDTAALADAGQLDALAACGADLVIVDEPADPVASPWAHPDTVAALHRVPGTFGLVLARSPLTPRPEALQAMLGWVDLHHFGTLAGQPTGAGPDVNPDSDPEALVPWLLRRTKTRVLRQLPETVETTTRVPLDAEARAVHDSLYAQVQRTAQRWQRSRYLSDIDQRQLVQTLHTLRQTSNSAKTGAVLATLDALLQPVEAKVVVFSQWPDSLAALAEVLKARGTALRHLTPDLNGEARRTLVSEFQQDPALRVLLCCDDERGGQLGLRHAATALVHLDRPWNPALLMQRFSRIHRADRVRQVPVHHLIAADSLEARLAAAQDDAATRELFVGVIDGPQADIFMSGTRLARFMGAVEALVLKPA